jgi:hypothetical protein
MPDFKHQPVFDIPNFDRVTTDKLAHYYIVCQSVMFELQRRHNITALTPLYENAERKWNADPINNPIEFPPNPLTPEVVKRFYQKCDAICDNTSVTKDDTPKCVPPSNILVSRF